jgi:N4-gp56 family major capsid protein
MGQMQTFGLTPGRINKFKGQILKHAVPVEVLAKGGRQVKFPKNNSDTYVARRWVPYGATTTNPNQFFQNATGDRANTLVNAHLTQEGVTVLPESITPMDISVVMQQYSCLYGFSDKTYDLYEDDIPQAMQEQIGERVALVNEMIVYGIVKASTNQWYGGTGTSRATVNGKLTLPLIRKIVKSLQANHGKSVTRVLSASNQYGTDAVASGFIVYCHTDLEPDIRDLPGFTPIEKYSSGTPMANEVGKCERFRFVTSPDLPSYQDAGAAIGTLGLYSTTGTSIDVYPLIVAAEDAWSQVAVRGKESLDPTFLPPGQKSKSDPFGQRGYAGTIWWKAAMVENYGWLAVANVGVTNL